MGQTETTLSMKIIILSVYLLLLSHQTVTDEQVQHVIGERGENTTLQCNSPQVNVSTLYQWKKNGVVIASQNPPEPSDRLSILNNGSLKISGLQYIDGGQYQCESQPEGFGTWQPHSNLLLQVAGGPTNIVLNITQATALKNGTLFVKKGSDVFFNCSSESVPSQNLTWMFENSTLTGAVQKDFGNKSTLGFSISDIQPGDQGIYTCISQNTLSMRTESKSQELLVYYAPERHPECSWEKGNGPSDFLFICTWNEGYPIPTLEWHEVFEQSVKAKGPTINSTSQETERLEVHVNKFILSHGEEVKCMARHVTGEENNCSFTLQIPYPKGDPLVTALEGTNVTLRCTETNSLPPATTVWKKNNTVINSTSKYILSENELQYTLTIVNVTKEDEGLYKCYSENPLDVRELDVYLTVKTTSGDGGIVVGIFVSVLIIMIGIVAGVTAYTYRDRICIGLGSSSEDRGDIFSLVDSDEEEIFHDAVPRLPPLTNGHATTLVEIHRIPSNEDAADSSEYTDQIRTDQTEPEQ